MQYSHPHHNDHQPKSLQSSRESGIRHSPTCALQQTASSLLHQKHGDHLHIFVDDSVVPDKLNNGSLRSTCSAEEQAVSPLGTRELNSSGGTRPPPRCQPTRGGAARDPGSHLLRLQGGSSQAAEAGLGQPEGRPTLEQANGTPRGGLLAVPALDSAHVAIPGNEEADALAKSATTPRSLSALQ